MMGIGSILIHAALDFCNEHNYHQVYLWTFKGLDIAQHLYDKAGFVLTEETPNNDWSSVDITEQKMKLESGRRNDDAR